MLITMMLNEPEVNQYRLCKRFLLISITTISLLGILNYLLLSDNVESSGSVGNNNDGIRGGTILSALKNLKEKLEKLHSSGIEEDQQFLYDRPFVVLTKGCSGSTAVHNHIIGIFNQHGLQSGTLNNEEILRGCVNPVYKKLMREKGETVVYQKSIKVVNNDVMIEALKKIQEDFKAEKKIFTFKINDDEYKGISLGALNPVIVGMYRDNPFDRCICSVRDCFDHHLWGYPVFAVNDTKTDLCFKRRQHPEVKIKAYLYDDAVVDCINFNQKESAIIDKLTTPTALESNLFAYEYSDDEHVFQVSLSEWIKFLEPFLGNVLSVQKVTEYLSKYRNTRPYPFHDDVVQNIGEISNVLKAHGFDMYLRLDDSTEN